MYNLPAEKVQIYYEKEVEHEAAFPIRVYFYNCYRTVRHEKRGIQWNLRIKDKLVHGPLSTIRGLSFIWEFLSKSRFCVL